MAQQDAWMPNVVAYDSVVDLLGDIVPGDHVMVTAPGGGHHHHGIFVGKQQVAGINNKSAVVGLLDERNGLSGHVAVGVRSLSDFVRDAVGFAKAVYPPCVAQDPEHSVRVALGLAGTDDVSHGHEFATICRCRCMRSAASCHIAIAKQLVHLPVIVPSLHRSGFK